MELFEFHIPEAAVGIIVVLLFMVFRRMARHAGKATGAVVAARSAPANSTPADVPPVAATGAPSATFTTFTTTTTTTAASQTNGELGVAEVTSVSCFGSATRAELELDAIGVPKRRVSAEVPAGLTLERGDRIYVMLDPNDDQTVSVLPPSMTGGQTLPKEGNRLDALVLGPQILRVGSKATGVVKAAESRPLANPALGARGMSKWALEFEVTPEQGWPYRADLTVTLSTPEKVQRIAHVGADVPLRYDPEDTKTIAIDSIAMGYGDPYASLANIANPLNQNATAVAPTVSAGVADGVGRSVAGALGSTGGDYRVVMIDGGPNKINAIKALRDLRPDLSLKAAKDIVESRWETNLFEGLSQPQAQAIGTMFEKVGSRVEVRLV